MLVLRTNGTELFVRTKVSKATATAMEKAGFFTNYNEQFGYIDGDVHKYVFEFRGNKYKIEYFSGCFNPFLLQLKRK
jgi:hypothetical protein